MALCQHHCGKAELICPGTLLEACAVQTLMAGTIRAPMHPILKPKAHHDLFVLLVRIEQDLFSAVREDKPIHRPSSSAILDAIRKSMPRILSAISAAARIEFDNGQI